VRKLYDRRVSIFCLAMLNAKDEKDEKKMQGCGLIKYSMHVFIGIIVKSYQCMHWKRSKNIKS
jgi:hypothetical protein